MPQNAFREVSINESNPKWNKCIRRSEEIYRRADDIRSEFTRDYNRILHCNAYRRLKHKTQVFFATSNDHICTRVEHVNHVSSVSYTISKHLGLNTELTSAIALGHDLGHAPFGHTGETFLKSIMSKEINDTFWHERNSLRFVDLYETLPDTEGIERNLNLTYAVRDGIISHCGEVDDSELYPREEDIDLCSIEKASQYSPFTWEGCIVKISDKISYLGRDIEDAISLKILSFSQLKELSNILKNTLDLDLRELNNTVLLHEFMIDLCKESSPDKGIKLSAKHYDFMKAIKDFNYENIYKHKRLTAYKKYAEIVITSTYETLKDFYDGEGTLSKLDRCKELYPTLTSSFSDWLIKYSDLRNTPKVKEGYQSKVNSLGNKIVYQIADYNDYIRAIVDYISGMTDSFAIKVFHELTTF
ncbi:MAG: dNTP triphosphohydrolase [Clostridia bacterium]|nr:dNTP triphosphohydrolase [Clostridia bacterium]